MWAFNKKVVTRVAHGSLERIMVVVLSEAKALAPNTPEHPVLKAAALAERTSSRATLLGKKPEDGCIPNAVLTAKGFVVGAEIEEKFGDKRGLTIMVLAGDEKPSYVK